VFTLTKGISSWIGYNDADQDEEMKWTDNTKTDFENMSKNCTGREMDDDCKPEEKAQQWYDWEELKKPQLEAIAEAEKNLKDKYPLKILRNTSHPIHALALLGAVAVALPLTVEAMAFTGPSDTFKNMASQFKCLITAKKCSNYPQFAGKQFPDTHGLNYLGVGDKPSFCLRRAEEAAWL